MQQMLATHQAEHQWAQREQAERQIVHTGAMQHGQQAGNQPHHHERPEQRSGLERAQLKYEQQDAGNFGQVQQRADACLIEIEAQGARQRLDQNQADSDPGHHRRLINGQNRRVGLDTAHRVERHEGCLLGCIGIMARTKLPPDAQTGASISEASGGGERLERMLATA
ncbi:hypothetical protein ALQ64_01729 [Pseudomonas cannabina]|uniref:Uncharacterized protein n=1 Tax=Pseudomonas cannabina TaxID=86840 RepID=A0A3M3LYP8_PSECA|nr:hypothetical protein ALQ64_01729 [Pseudomonas cannabina]